MYSCVCSGANSTQDCHTNSSLRRVDGDTHLLQRPCYQRARPCQDPAGKNPTTRRPPDHSKETQTEVVWACLPFIGSGQNHLARHSEWGKKKTSHTEEEVEDNIGEWTGLEFAKSQRAVENRKKKKMEETGCEIICRPPTTPAVKR